MLRCNLLRIALVRLQPFAEHALENSHGAGIIAHCLVGIARRPGRSLHCTHNAGAAAASATLAGFPVATPPALIEILHHTQNVGRNSVGIVIVGGHHDFSAHALSFPRVHADRPVQRCAPCCARRGREAPQGASSDVTPPHVALARYAQAHSVACAALTQAARLATLHRGGFALRSRVYPRSVYSLRKSAIADLRCCSSGTGWMSRAHPYPAGFRPRSAGSSVQQDYLQPLVIGAA